MKLKDLIIELLSSTGGRGPSCTRLIYALNGVGAALCATVASLAGMFVYCSPAHTANPVYWGGVAAPDCRSHRTFSPYFCVTGGTMPFIRRYSTNCP